MSKQRCAPTRGQPVSLKQALAADTVSPHCCHTPTPAAATHCVSICCCCCCLLLQVVQPDKFTLALRLRTPLSHGWLHLSWHPTAARLCMGRPPARGDVSEGFALAQQVRQVVC